MGKRGGEAQSSVRAPAYSQCICWLGAIVSYSGQCSLGWPCPCLSLVSLCKGEDSRLVLLAPVNSVGDVFK